MANRIQLRRGTTTEWNTTDPILAEGEIGIDLSVNKYKLGDGVTEWSLLDYASGDIDIEVATEEEALEGVDNTTGMTPLRVKQVLDAGGYVFTDPYDTPGPKTGSHGSMQEGYFGTVSANDFITGDALATAIGLDDGTSQFSDTDWLKLAGDGKILFTPMKAIRYDISWNHILAKGAVWGDGTTGGDRTVQVQGFTFKVRLFRGLNNAYDPKTVPAGYDGVHCHGSEWNRLILPLHIGAKTGSWGSYGSNVESGLPYWGTDFTDADLQVTSGNGRVNWCQNYAYSSTSSCYRGNLGVADSAYSSSSNTGTGYGWRPVLELVTS